MIGKGGMGRVYLAEDVRLHMKWAIKELECSREYMSEARRAEISVLRRAAHPNLPRITDVFNENGHTYIVMDYIEGRSLKEIISAGEKITLKVKIRWSMQIASALSYLHSRHPAVIYRDLKPSNIMIRNNGSAALIDFGAARQYRPSDDGESSAVGTKGYAAPEQYEGIADRRSDVYSLGCTMRAICCGTEPVMFKCIIRKCMRSEPSKRYRNAGEVLQALKMFDAITKAGIGLITAVVFAAAVLVKVRNETAASENRVQEMVESGRYEELYDYALMCFYDLEDYPEAMRYLKQIPEDAVPESVYYREITQMLLTMDTRESEILKVLGRFRKFNESCVEQADLDRKMKNDLNMARIYMTYAGDDSEAANEAVSLCSEVAADAGAGRASSVYYREALSMLSDIFRQLGQKRASLREKYYRKAVSCNEELLAMKEIHEDGEQCRMKYRDSARMLEELGKYDAACRYYRRSESEFPREGQDIYLGHLKLLIQSGSEKKELLSVLNEAGKVEGMEYNTTYLKIKERIEKYEEN